MTANISNSIAAAAKKKSSSGIMQIKNITKRFGGLTALDSCSLSIEEGIITAIIGPNGAGKTTLFNIISGLMRADSGSIVFGNSDLTELEPHQIANLGISRTFQQTRLFKNLTIRDNLVLAKEASDDKLLPMLQKLNIKKPLSTIVSDLSYGQQRLVELTRALLLPHSLLLLDEPTAGVNQAVREEIKTILQQFRKEGRTITFVEHDMDFVMDISDEIIVLNEGRVLARGKPATIRKNPKVLEAYLGK